MSFECPKVGVGWGATDADKVISYKADGTSNKVYTVKEGEDFRGPPQSVKLNSWLYRVILLGFVVGAVGKGRLTACQNNFRQLITS